MNLINKVKKSLPHLLLCSLAVGYCTWGVADEIKGVDFPLEKQLLVIKEENGFLACAYIDVETCNKLGEACAIVSGVNNYDDMKIAKVIKASEAAQKLGVMVGDTGSVALEKFSLN